MQERKSVQGLVDLSWFKLSKENIQAPHRLAFRNIVWLLIG
jgi:hypothetical protein